MVAGARDEGKPNQSKKGNERIMIKNSLKQKERDWEWQHRAVPEAMSRHFPTAGKLTTIWRCRKYEVLVIQYPDDTVHLSIKDPTRRHSWQELQRIKNDVLGEHWAAVEVYPSERLVVDEADIYHLWCTTEKLRVGWDDGGEYTVRHTFYLPQEDPAQECEAWLHLQNPGAVAGLLEREVPEAIIQATVPQFIK